MEIWTIQKASVIQTLNQQGFYAADPLTHEGQEQFFSRYYKKAYDWLIQEMRQRVSLPPRPEIVYPLWGWRQWRSQAQPEPDLRSSSEFGAKGEELVKIHCELPAEQILLSDFDLWHHCLNNLPYAEGATASDPQGWQKIFDLEWRSREFPVAMAQKNIQACFWILETKNILDYHFFKVR